MWTRSDQKFLRSLRICVGDPLASLPRFRVEPAPRPGWYRVMDMDRRDRQRRPMVKSEIGPPLKDPRSAAEDLARQLNGENVANT